jgi:hypothetical protein
MNLLCKIFGHTPPRYYGEIHYGQVVRGGTDGCGTEHAHVEAECERCRQRYLVIKIHLPPLTVEGQSGTPAKEQTIVDRIKL